MRIYHLAYNGHQIYHLLEERIVDFRHIFECDTQTKSVTVKTNQRFDCTPLKKPSTVRVLSFSVAEILSQCSTDGVRNPTAVLQRSVLTQRISVTSFFQFITVLFPQNPRVWTHEHAVGWTWSSFTSETLKVLWCCWISLHLIDVPPAKIHMWAMSLFYYFSISSMSSVQFSRGYHAVTINKALTFKQASEVECAALIALSFLPTIRGRRRGGNRERERETIFLLG